MPTKARVSHTTCDACGSALLVKVQVSVPNVRRARLRIKRKGPDVEAVLAEVKRALGVRKKRKDAGKPKPKRKAPVRYEKPQPQAKKAKRQRRKAGAVGTMRALVRNCGCKLTGRHKKTCYLAKANYDNAVVAKHDPKDTLSQKQVDGMAQRKLANANKAEANGAPKRALSAKGKAAIAALDPVARPIKAGG